MASLTKDFPWADFQEDSLHKVLDVFWEEAGGPGFSDHVTRRLTRQDTSWTYDTDEEFFAECKRGYDSYSIGIEATASQPMSTLYVSSDGPSSQVMISLPSSNGIARVMEIFDTAYANRAQSPAELDMIRTMEGITSYPKRAGSTVLKRVFISHAFADRELADLIQQTLILGGVPHTQVFYSSARASGIPAGEDIRKRLRTELQEAGLVLELISENFLSRTMCLLELGAAWALDKPTYPIIVPPLTRDRAVHELGSIYMASLHTGSEQQDLFDELSSRLERDLGIKIDTAQWNSAVRLFTQKFEKI